MSGLATPQPSPNEYNNTYSLPPKSNLKQDRDLYPIDETEDFQDPFSDLSLFLTKKVKEEIGKRGGVKKWNHQIQTELLKSILPEFKEKFPRYRLGIAALKKTWEKFISYQQKISSFKQAFLPNGKLNQNFLIKENIRNFQNNAPSHELHPYNHAQNLAVNLSECIATLDGECPKLGQMTKTIWAIQKHLIPDTIPKASSPFEENDPIDKLIVRAMLSNIVKSPLSSHEELAKSVKQTVLSLLNLPFLSSLEELTAFLSMMIARKISKASKVLKDLTNTQAKHLKRFVFNHIQRSTPSKQSSQKSNRLTLVQKILALYPLCSLIPKDIQSDKLKSAVRLIYNEKSHSFLTDYPNFDPTLYAFIKTEILLLKDKKGAYTLEKIESAIVEAYNEITHAPFIDEAQMDQLEIFLWTVIDQFDQKTDTLFNQGFAEVLEEIENAIIENPHFSFHGLVQSLSQSFKLIRKMRADKLDEKIAYWTIQNDLVCRFIHFDKHSSLYSLIRENYCDEQTHDQLVAKVCDQFLEKHLELANSRKQIVERTWILYKHFWYQERYRGQSSLEAFIHWHKKDLQSLSQEQREQELARRIQTLLPLTPFPERLNQKTDS